MGGLHAALVEPVFPTAENVEQFLAGMGEWGDFPAALGGRKGTEEKLAVSGDEVAGSEFPEMVFVDPDE